MELTGEKRYNSGYMWQKTKNLYHLAVAVVANTLFLFPARRLKIIGITGTDGKTTTTSLIYHILKTAGKKVSLISTVAAHIGDTTFDTGFHVTNPSSIPLQKFLKKITCLGTGKEENYLILEVTSHGIDQNRIWGIPFAIAGITNVTHEHLDYHKTYEKYIATKAKLLEKARIAILNKDDGSYKRINEKLQAKNKRQKIVTYGFGSNADVNPKTVQFTTGLAGKYNQYNCLLAVAVCKELDIANDSIQKGIATFIPPMGRGETVYKKDFTVMVDFAHTPNALMQLLSSLRPEIKGHLIHVFGSAGARDITKRPLMGHAASSFDDVIILTAEDPRREKIEEINRQITSGMGEKPLKLFEIPDRQAAITKAITMAKKGDFIVITGKGHEMSMNYGHGEKPWSDKDAVLKALAKL